MAAWAMRFVPSGADARALENRSGSRATRSHGLPVNDTTGYAASIANSGRDRQNPLGRLPDLGLRCAAPIGMQVEPKVAESLSIVLVEAAWWRPASFPTRLMGVSG